MTNKRALVVLAWVCGVASGCVLETGTNDDPEVREAEFHIQAANRLAANRLAANSLNASKLGAFKLAAASLNNNSMLATPEGRDVFSFVVGCALDTGTTLSLTYGGATYNFAGWLGLAPAWATRLPTVAERRGITSCVLARTNLTGTQVEISMRHDTYAPLASTAAERAAFTKLEGAFYGDIFQTNPTMYACATRTWTAADAGTSARHCALSQNGTTTECGFTYTGLCNSTSNAACTDKAAPFGGCKGGTIVHNEAITIYLK